MSSSSDLFTGLSGRVSRQMALQRGEILSAELYRWYDIYRMALLRRGNGAFTLPGGELMAAWASFVLDISTDRLHSLSPIDRETVIASLRAASKWVFKVTIPVDPCKGEVLHANLMRAAAEYDWPNSYV